MVQLIYDMRVSHFLISVISIVFSLVWNIILTSVKVNLFPYPRAITQVFFFFFLTVVFTLGPTQNL